MSRAYENRKAQRCCEATSELGEEVLSIFVSETKQNT